MRPKLCAVILTAMSAVGLSQETEPTKRTEITVNETILVPGKELPPGKYVLKLMNSASNRHIVQIYNEDQTQLQTTILAIPNERIQRTGDTVLTYWETPAGSPRALRAWFSPGDTLGQEFAYPKEMAERIARSNNNAQVPSFEGTPSAEQLSSVTLLEQSQTARPGDPVTAEAPRNTAAVQADAAPRSGAPASTDRPTDRPTATPQTTTELASPTRQADRAVETTDSTTPRATAAAGAQPATAAQGGRTEIGLEARSPIGAADRTSDQGAQTVLAQNNPPAGNQPQPAAAPDAQLPATASPAPLLLLISLVSLGGALFLRQRRA